MEWNMSRMLNNRCREEYTQQQLELKAMFIEIKLVQQTIEHNVN